MRKGITAIVVVLIGLLGITGCGGDSSLSRSEYEQKLELVCNAGLKKREEFIADVTRKYQRLQRQPNAKEQADNLRHLMAVYQSTTEEIAELGLPEQDEKKAEELVKAREDAVAKVKDDPQSALPAFEEIFADAYKAAEHFKADSCAR